MNRPTNSPKSEQTAATMWAYPHALGHTVMADIVGYQVIASDGEIGHVDQATDEIEAAAIVVDTGFWIFGKKRMIPAGVIDRIDAQDRTIQVRLTKDQIKQAPDFVEQSSSSADDSALHREDLVTYYSRWWG